MLGQISSKPGVSPVPEQISGQTRGFPSARANSRPGGGATPVLGQISGQRRGFASARANFRPNKGTCQCNNGICTFRVALAERIVHYTQKSLRSLPCHHLLSLVLGKTPFCSQIPLPPVTFLLSYLGLAQSFMVILYTLILVLHCFVHY